MPNLFDLNCDLGEGEPWKHTRALLKTITSANIACGGHAGDLDTMRRCVRAALRLKVHIGAHPGWPDRASAGRKDIHVAPAAFSEMLRNQVGALAAVCAAQGARLHHIKLHGFLYHACERRPTIRRALVAAMLEYWPRAILYCIAGGATASEARAAGLNVWEEAFVDRAYATATSLVSRDKPHALLSRREAIDQARSLLSTKTVVTRNDFASLPGLRTLCVHSDSPDALYVARAIRRRRR